MLSNLRSRLGMLKLLAFRAGDYLKPNELPAWFNEVLMVHQKKQTVRVALNIDLDYGEPLRVRKFHTSSLRLPAIRES